MWFNSNPDKSLNYEKNVLIARDLLISFGEKYRSYKKWAPMIILFSMMDRMISGQLPLFSLRKSIILYGKPQVLFPPI
jgi:hypothetical protein